MRLEFSLELTAIIKLLLLVLQVLARKQLNLFVKYSKPLFNAAENRKVSLQTSKQVLFQPLLVYKTSKYLMELI